MSSWRPVVAIAAANLRRVLRDRTGLFFVVVLPIVIIIVIGSTFGTGDVAFDVGVVNGDGSSALAGELHDRLERSPTLSLRRYDDAAALHRAVRRDEVSAGVVVPAGYDASLRSDRDVEVELVADPTAEATTAVRSAVSAEVAAQAGMVAAARFAGAETGRGFGPSLEKARRLEATARTVSVDARTIGDRVDPVSSRFAYTAPSNLVLFVFVNSLAAAGALVETRRLGITRRLLATPTSAPAILAGEALGRFAVALLQAVLILLVGALMFDVDWGDPLAAGALVLVFVLVGTGAAMLVGTLFRTGDQASSVGPPIGIAFGMLGGCMWPLEVVGDTMRAVGHVVPHAWAMDAWAELIFDREGFGAIAPELGVLAVWATALLLVAAARLNRSITASAAGR